MNNNCTISRWIIGITLLLVVAILGVMWNRRRHPEPPELGSAVVDVKSIHRKAHNKNDATAEVRGRNEAGRHIARDQLAVRDVVRDGGRRIALSEDEARWLARHHYPTDKDLETVGSLDLRKTYEAYRDPMKATLYGKRLMDDGEYLGAAGLLERAAVYGSIYAYEEAAIAQFKLYAEQNAGMVTQQNKDVLMARLQVAKLLGDHRASVLIQELLPSYDIGVGAVIPPQIS